MDEDGVRMLAPPDFIERVIIVFEPAHLLGDDFLVRTQEADGVRRHSDNSAFPSSGKRSILGPADAP